MKYKGRWRCTKAQTRDILMEWAPMAYEVTWWHNRSQLEQYEALAEAIVDALDTRITTSVMKALLESEDD